MSRNNECTDKDELRALFTSWLRMTLLNAKNRYYRTQMPKIEMIPLDEIPPEQMVDPVNRYERVERTPNSFDFAEEYLAKAYSELPLMRQEVLRLLFVFEMTPEEISQKLHCSPAYIRKQKYKALATLRKLIKENLI